MAGVVEDGQFDDSVVGSEPGTPHHRVHVDGPSVFGYRKSFREPVIFGIRVMPAASSAPGRILPTGSVPPFRARWDSSEPALPSSRRSR